MRSPRAHVPGRALLQRCQQETEFWRNVAALARFARSQDLPPFRNQDKRRLWPRPGWNRARTPEQIPRQRAVPSGLSTRPRAR